MKLIIKCPCGGRLKYNSSWNDLSCTKCNKCHSSNITASAYKVGFEAGKISIKLKFNDLMRT